jgi:hypothetical protein
MFRAMSPEDGRQLEGQHESEADDREKDQLADQGDDHRLRLLEHSCEVGEGEAQTQAEHDDSEGDGEPVSGQR